MFAANVDAPTLIFWAAVVIIAVLILARMVQGVIQSGPKCPQCYGTVDKRATVCPHCQAPITRTVK